MYEISNGGKNWKPWEAYTNGSYLRFMSRANKAAGNPDSSGIDSGGSTDATQAGLGNVLNFPSAISDFFEFLTDPITWMRLGMIVGGGVMVAVALVQISGAGSQLGQAANAAIDFVPGGGIVKKAATAAKAGKAAKAVK
jgi:hypothetical protein